MSYIYLNLVENLKRASKTNRDFYTSSLLDQYEVIKRKLGLEVDFNTFLAYLFPIETSKNYYISMPSFKREFSEANNGKRFLNNVVIRPGRGVIMDSIMPSNWDFILIGDIMLNSNNANASNRNMSSINVRGMELIDSKALKHGEICISCNVAVATANKTINRDGNFISVPDYGSANMNAGAINYDFIDRLCKDETSYPVPNPIDVIRTCDEWEQYIKFRRYYLGKESERCEQITDVNVCDSYMITKKTFKENVSLYSDYILDGLDGFSKGEQIILSEKIGEAESFPLIRVDIVKNRKQIKGDSGADGKRNKSKYEKELNRFTKEELGLSPIQPTFDEEGNMPPNTKFDPFLLGERYLFGYVDIEPDCSKLEKEYQKSINDEFEKINNRYSSLIQNDLSHYSSEKRKELELKYDQLSREYEDSLDNALLDDISNNRDKAIKNEYERIVKEKSKPFDDDIRKLINKTNEKIEKLKNKNKDQAAIDYVLEEKNEKIEEIERKKAKEIEKIDLKKMYLNRNKKLVVEKEKSNRIQAQTELSKLMIEKKKQLEAQYKNPLEEEKKQIETELKRRYEATKKEKIENETIRQYQIYFKPDSNNDSVEKMKNEISNKDLNYLIFDNRAEKSKIDRQDKALNLFKLGYVRNPFLATYLFSPESLSQSTSEGLEDPNWYLENLNDSQKTAVKRALASESIFLLQGPPGTGKTQVIAEITAQFAKQGKKVLISSETHKAIDNVFDRLPKIPEIRPLRLIPSQNGKDTQYSPEKLVDNFYLNISGTLEKQIDRYEHFEETKTTFNEQMRALRFDYNKLLNLKKENKKLELESKKIIDVIDRLNSELDDINEQQTPHIIEKETLSRTKRFVEDLRFESDDIKEEYINELRNRISEKKNLYETIKSINISNLNALININLDNIKDEITQLTDNDDVVALESRRSQLREILSKLRDPDTDEPPLPGDANYEEYKKYQGELMAISKKIKESENTSNFDVSNSKIYSLNPSLISNTNLLKRLPNEIVAFKKDVTLIIKDIIRKIDSEISKIEFELNDLDSKRIDIQKNISDNKMRYESITSDEGVEEYSNLNSSLKNRITAFFRDFSIIREYDSDNLETAFSIIDEEWDKLERNFNKTAQENKRKIPMYKEICKYLNEADIIEEDRQAYTSKLYECANVFGITCTSRDRFSKRQISELSKYGIDEIDIRTQGIDVVIVDEVSKSSFLDLLIPIMYGKTIILVGDHRQLPPTYDLKHLRDEDFDGLDASIINKHLNDKYTELYETCFFKTLYDKIPSDFKMMLNKQYRCHSDIMDVFNHFYGGDKNGLQIGKKQLNDEKEHNLTVKINDKTIIEPKYHIYFVDCDEYESSAYEGSTSKINEQEAKVSVELAKRINKACEDAIASGKMIVNKEKKKDERPSLGIICTYGDQAALIKKKRRNQRFAGITDKEEEKLVINTVDDFQGDERDIIILSMVRNPRNLNYSNAEFIKKFERINVALSRARKMLIIVGSQKYLSEACVIDRLPDLSGNKKNDKINFHVFREIIDTIKLKGRVIKANDILESDE